jgi:hypothetical protein
MKTGLATGKGTRRPDALFRQELMPPSVRQRSRRCPRRRTPWRFAWMMRTHSCVVVATRRGAQAAVIRNVGFVVVSGILEGSGAIGDRRETLAEEVTLADPLVVYDVDDKVGIVTLNRPDKLNAISRELQHALTEAFQRADADAATTSAPRALTPTIGAAIRRRRMRICSRSSNSRWRRG